MTTTAPGQRACIATNAAGEPCGAWAVNGSDFCVAHDPQHTAQMAAARRRGGRARHGRSVGPVEDAEPVTLAGPADVLKVIEGEINMLLGLERSIARARAVGALLSVFVSTWESSELERRVQALEALNERKTHTAAVVG